jgi:hypothetical protein
MKKFASEIYAAGRARRLPKIFNAADVRRCCPGWGELTYDRFLAKHAVGNPGGHTELFVRVARGLYRLHPGL